MELLCFEDIWDFYARRCLGGTGGYTYAVEVRPTEGWSKMTSNAMDGTIIDRDRGY